MDKVLKNLILIIVLIDMRMMIRIHTLSALFWRINGYMYIKDALHFETFRVKEQNTHGLTWILGVDMLETTPLESIGLNVHVV
jgi:hypothetical protein